MKPSHTPSSEPAWFWSFLVLLGLAPLGLGGNRPLAWSLLSLGLVILLLWWLWLALKDSRSLASIRRPILVSGPGSLWLPLLLVLLVLTWGLIQALIPVVLPGWQDWASPLWQIAAETLDSPLHRSPLAKISINPQATLTAMLLFAVYIATFILALQIGCSRHRAGQFFAFMAVVGLVYSAYGLLMHLGGYDLVLGWKRWAYQDSVTSTFVNRNHFASWVGLTLLCSVAVFANGLPQIYRPRSLSQLGELVSVLLERRGYLLLSLLLCGAALVLTQSRAGNFSTLLALLVLLGLLRKAGGRRHSGNGGIDGYLGLALMLGMAAVVVAVGGDTIARIGEASLSDGRGDAFKITLQGISQTPLQGHGMGAFADVFSQYRDVSLPGVKRWNHAHNSYLEGVLGLGIPATLAVCVAVFWVAIQCGMGVFRRHRDIAFPAIGLAATVLIGLHALMDFSLHTPAVGMTYCAILGVAYAQSWPSSTLSSRGVRQSESFD